MSSSASFITEMGASRNDAASFSKPQFSHIFAPT